MRRTGPRPFGKYVLLERLAAGGMGEVWLAKHGGFAGIERYCVVKTLRPDLAADREYIARFLDEARIVVALTHANIAPVFEVGKVGDEVYLALEHVQGRDLAALLARARAVGRPLPTGPALHVLCGVLDALDYAHRRTDPATGEPLGLVHRDVSPKNVLVSFDGDVKLIDFGVAHTRVKVEKTEPHVVLGRAAYMAPEHARGEPTDARADVFATAVLAYEVLAGERFYAGVEPMEVLHTAAQGGHRPPGWRRLNDDVRAVLEPALAPDREGRTSSAGDLRDAFAGLLHWRFPGTGARSLREVVQELFTDDVAADRDRLAGYAKVQLPEPTHVDRAPSTDEDVPSTVLERRVDTTDQGSDEPTGPRRVEKTEVVVRRPDVTQVIVARVERTEVVRRPEGTEVVRRPHLATRPLYELPRRRRAPIVAAAAGLAALVVVVVVVARDGAGTSRDAAPDVGTVPSSPTPRVAAPAVVLAPAVLGDAPPEVGDAPQVAGDAPTVVGDAPPEVGDSPSVVGDAPSVVDPARGDDRVRPATARERIVDAVAPAHVRWTSATGRVLGTGRARLKVPGGDADVVAFDTKRRVRTRMPVAAKVDYGALARGSLTVRALPFADVKLGDESIGQTPVNQLQVVAGSYEVTLTHEGRAVVRSVVVKPGAEAIVSVNMEK